LGAALAVRITEHAISETKLFIRYMRETAMAVIDWAIRVCIGIYKRLGTGMYQVFAARPAIRRMELYEKILLASAAAWLIVWFVVPKGISDRKS
jgi:hypothetical protein